MQRPTRSIGCPGARVGDARAKVLGAADGFTVALVEAEPGYHGDPHVHAYPEFLYVVDGTIRNQGQAMVRGDGYAAAPGSSHSTSGPKPVLRTCRSSRSDLEQLTGTRQALALRLWVVTVENPEYRSTRHPSSLGGQHE